MLPPAQRPGVEMVRVDVPGAAHLELVEGVAYLDQPGTVFASMLAGWSTQQQSRMLAKSTIGPRMKTIRRFADFTGTYPWQWQPGDLDDFTTHLRSGSSPIAHSTARTYQTTIGMFCEYSLRRLRPSSVLVQPSRKFDTALRHLLQREHLGQIDHLSATSATAT